MTNGYQIELIGEEGGLGEVRVNGAQAGMIYPNGDVNFYTKDAYCSSIPSEQAVLAPGFNGVAMNGAAVEVDRKGVLIAHTRGCVQVKSPIFK
jgi:hypothetical protein